MNTVLKIKKNKSTKINKSLSNENDNNILVNYDNNLEIDTKETKVNKINKIENLKTNQNNEKIIVKEKKISKTTSLKNNLENEFLTELVMSSNDTDEIIKESKTKKNKDEYKLKFIDLFCGIGGFHQALKNIGYNCVFASDIDDKCRKIYKENYNITPEGDITKIDVKTIPNFDILCGGFPCQPFSKAGDQLGFDDHRGNLFFNICKIAEHHKPKYMILENVRNLATHDDGNTWKVIYDKIIQMGYNTYTEPIILNVLHFNIPQNRERVIILCKRKDLGKLPELPLIPKNPKLLLTNSIKNIIDNTTDNSKFKIDGKMKEVEKIWNNFIKILIKNAIYIPKFPIWTDMWDADLKKNKEFYKKYTNWIDKNREFYQTNIKLLKPWLDESRNNESWFGAVRKFEWQAGDLLDNDSMNTILWTARGSGIRIKRPDYIPTLVAMSMIPVYGPESRKLSPRELLRLQSFPDTFKYDEKSIYKQVGNAVNVKMIEKCARFLILGEYLLK